MRYFLLVETAAGSGQFALLQHDVTTASASAAIAALQPLAPSDGRIGVWPYRRMTGTPDPLGAVEAEAGQAYLVLEQSAGTAGLFVLTADELDSTAALDAGAAVVMRQARTGLRTGLMPKPAAAAAPAPAASAPSSPAAA